MDSRTAVLLERIRAQMELSPLDWDAPRDATEYHAVISEAIYDIADMVGTYQDLHRLMTERYRDLAVLRRVGEYMAQMPDVRLLESRHALQLVMDDLLAERVRLSVDLLANGCLSDTMGRAMRFPGDLADELIEMGHQLFRTINTRTLVLRPTGRHQLDANWTGRFDGIRNHDEMLKAIDHQRQLVLDYQDDTPEDQQRYWYDAFAHWDYIQNCPAYSERAAIALTRNAREWRMVSDRELSDDMYPYLDVYCGKLVLEHGRLQFRLMMLYTYYRAAGEIIKYHEAMVEEGADHYGPGHPAHQDFVKIQTYLRGGHY